jgi:hypothetical protein
MEREKMGDGRWGMGDDGLTKEEGKHYERMRKEGSNVLGNLIDKDDERVTY